MSILELVGLTLSAVLGVYLVFALLKPEIFQ